jgi:nitric oxide reductase activation protein
LTENQKDLHSIELELQQLPPAVSAEFHKALRSVARRLTAEEICAWGQEGMAVAMSGFRCWEAAANYFRVTPQVLPVLNFPQLINWVRCGRMLSETSASLSSAYFQESPAFLNSSTANHLEEWARLGRSLYQGTWWSNSLAGRFFQVSPGLFRYLNAAEIAQFTTFIDCLARNRHELASDCLNLAEEAISPLEKADCPKFLALALVFAETNWNNARTYFTSGAQILTRIQHTERARFLSLAEVVCRRSCEQAIPFLADGSQALGQLPKSTHHQLLDLTEELLRLSGSVAIEFLKSCPAVLGKVSLSGLERWFRQGVRILENSEEGAVAYFRLELNKSQQVLEQLSSGLELARVKEILTLYWRALTGRDHPILPAGNSEANGIGWASLGQPGTEGEAIFLPELVERYRTKEENFTWYKVMLTHQAGHVEFGSFVFCFERKSNLFPDLRSQLAQKSGLADAPTDLRRFFSLFDDRVLATDIFTVVEDARVDFLVNREYKGIRRDYQSVQKDALKARPPLHTRPLREALLEILIQISLDSREDFFCPPQLHISLQQASLILKMVQSPQATVEDAAEATIRLYQILSQIPNLPGPAKPGELSRDSQASPAPATVDTEDKVLPYTSPPEVEFRGEFKPGLIQLLAKLKTERRGKRQVAPSTIPLEVLRQLMDNGALIDMTMLTDGQVAPSLPVFVTDTSKEPAPQSISPPRPQSPLPTREDMSDESLENEDYLSFLYDEWDFQANDYRPKWCRVRQKTLGQGRIDFFETTLKDHAALANQIRRQFEMLRPEGLRKEKRLPDGEEFDFDAVIDSIVEKRAGKSFNEKVYLRKNKTERDVSVVFLLDMSASTSEYIDPKQKEAMEQPFFKDYREYLDWLEWQRQTQDRKHLPKRIIDLEKESVVLLMKALEMTGDTYAIYGFSGYGREHAEFYVIKDLQEEFSDCIKGRIDSISPMHATRMGPAIRHATWKLDQHQSRSKYLFLISDGRPQDQGYGRDGLEKEYAINDTRVALLEARWKSITPFCITVDRVGHDYLKTMCRDLGYEVVADIESLPKRLPALYRQLTV